MANFKLFFVAAGLAALLFSCGKSDTASDGANRDRPPTDGNNGDTTNDPDLRVKYFSDIRDLEVSNCQQGQSFAFEKCWDSVDLNSNGSVTLKNSIQELPILVSGYINADLLTAYHISSSCQPGGSGASVIDLALHSNEKHGFDGSGYWFLPRKFKIHDTDHDCTPKNQEVTTFKIHLMNYTSEKNYWYVNGSIVLCGKKLDLPIEQKAVEEACNVVHGDDLWGLIVLGQNLNVQVTYNRKSKIPGGTTPEKTRYVSELEFREAYKKP